MDGVCSCRAPFEGSSCAKLSALATTAEGAPTAKAAVLLGMRKSTAATKSNASDVMVKTEGQDSSDYAPMTASWLSSGLIRPAAQKAPVAISSGSPDIMKKSAAVSSGDALWHAALVPPAAKSRSILSLLASKPAKTSLLRSSGGAWKEHPLQSTWPGHSHQAAAVPKTLASLLALSSKATAPSLLSANIEEPDSQSSEVDALLSDI